MRRDRQTDGVTMRLQVDLVKIKDSLAGWLVEGCLCLICLKEEMIDETGYN